MQQMASRPFASINVALETDEEPPDLIGGSIKGGTLAVQAPLKGVLSCISVPEVPTRKDEERFYKGLECQDTGNGFPLPEGRDGWDLGKECLAGRTVPKPIALEPCFGNKAAVLSVFVRLPRGLGGIPPPGQSGLAVASALVDISQQMPIAYKEKSGAIRNRKQQPPAQPGTCI
ncbi:hypothetical protein DUI87_22150 [Hirundo rustica rustica]|uniref:Attractin n=1 Tax=Hirundo rustica rustica TaxID=333673 RepID=A0A3M0JM25_HIRRU|nr:hypothetical protein DUI87_22150 [Hirundo rustica rustica]